MMFFEKRIHPFDGVDHRGAVTAHVVFFNPIGGGDQVFFDFCNVIDLRWMWQ
jgi:hypothetical protein